ncbi:MAG: C-type lectin domain-containing protein [Myxococcales bacterium]|nr:C-type lectin domain-containing protein [Myxococcales bacterium]
MPPCLPSSLSTIGAAALLAACSTTVSGNQQATPPDAAVSVFPDAAQQQAAFDAAPAASPCIEGESQATNPADDTCYMLFETALTWQAAQAACLTVGATLAIVDSEAEQTIVAGLSASFPLAGPDLWLGATDVLVETNFVWVDGTPMVFEKWRVDEPNNDGPGDAPENCLVIEGDTVLQEWDDRSCITPSPYICKRAPS